jgi:hypothetical protein
MTPLARFSATGRLVGSFTQPILKEILMKKSTIAAITFSCFIFTAGMGNANGLTSGSQASVRASTTISSGSGLVVEGASSLILAGGELIVEGVSTIGSKTVLVLKHVANGALVSVEVSGNMAGAASLAVGTTVQALTDAAGSMLVASGHAIAFVPNEVGKSLLFHARH